MKIKDMILSFTHLCELFCLEILFHFRSDMVHNKASVTVSRCVWADLFGNVRTIPKYTQKVLLIWPAEYFEGKSRCVRRQMPVVQTEADEDIHQRQVMTREKMEIRKVKQSFWLAFF